MHTSISPKVFYLPGPKYIARLEGVLSLTLSSLSRSYYTLRKLGWPQLWRKFSGGNYVHDDVVNMHSIGLHWLVKTFLSEVK